MIETYNIITIGVLDEDKKLVGITEENFKNLLKKAEKLDELQTRMKEIYGEGEELLETFVSGLEQYNSQQEEHPFKARLLTNETVDEWEAYQRAKSEERLIELPTKIIRDDVSYPMVYHFYNVPYPEEEDIEERHLFEYLKNIGVDVYFEKENIHSISQEGELLLTFLAAYAQAESENTSENIKWGIRKGFKVGKPNGYKAPYGYKWNGNSYSIVPEQGAIVKEIYKRYLDGEPAYSIAKALKKRGIKGQTGIPMDDSTIRYIVSNISYTGTLLLQKWFFTQNHVRKENKGELPMYAVENMFEPLISKEDFQKALQIKKERAEAMPNKNPRLTAFSGIVKCGNCGCSVCRRTTRYGKKWVCNAKDRKGMAACDFRDIYEIELEAAATKALAVNEFKEDLVRREVKLITIDNAYIVFNLKDGKKKQILRTYTKGYSGFSCRLFCGNCCKMLEADSRTLSINGQKKRYKIWCCRKCPGQREFDDVIRKATQSLFNEPQCEGLFAQNIEKAIIYNDRIDFYFKEGKVITWEKE